MPTRVTLKIPLKDFRVIERVFNEWMDAAPDAVEKLNRARVLAYVLHGRRI